MSDDDYIYDEATGEWRPASEIAAEKAAANVVHDAAGIEHHVLRRLFRSDLGGRAPLAGCFVIDIIVVAHGGIPQSRLAHAYNDPATDGNGLHRDYIAFRIPNGEQA